MTPNNQNISGIFNDVAADDQPDSMTGAEYAAAFGKLAAAYFTGKQSQKNPVLLYVTGLPGAGKSTFVKEARQQPAFAEQGIVINFDDLRVYHPRYEAHMKQDSVNAAAHIDRAVENLIGWLCAESAKRKINVILDDAAMGGKMTQMILSPFLAQGYAVDATVIAVPSLIARQSVHLRFEEDYAAAEAGRPALPRWVNNAEQDNAPAALVETVETMEEYGLAKSLKVLNRDGHTLPHPLAGAAVRNEMGRALTEVETADYQVKASLIAKLMHARTGSPKPGQNPALKK